MNKDAIDRHVRSRTAECISQLRRDGKLPNTSSKSTPLRSSYTTVNELAQAFLNGEVYLQRDVETALESLGEDPRQAHNLMRQWKENPESIGQTSR